MANGERKSNRETKKPKKTAAVDLPPIEQGKEVSGGMSHDGSRETQVRSHSNPGDHRRIPLLAFFSRKGGQQGLHVPAVTLDD